jgi:hypothetical protein
MSTFIIVISIMIMIIIKARSEAGPIGLSHGVRLGLLDM